MTEILLKLAKHEDEDIKEKSLLILVEKNKQSNLEAKELFRIGFLYIDYLISDPTRICNGKISSA